jgi:hypothetical protein
MDCCVNRANQELSRLLGTNTALDALLDSSPTPPTGHLSAPYAFLELTPMLLVGMRQVVILALQELSPGALKWSASHVHWAPLPRDQIALHA